jgi:dolichol-phosphate mannosyltransferase
LASALIIIPTYNEKENIRLILDAVFALPEASRDPEYHVLIVDDGSPDGTAQIVKEMQSQFAGRLHILERSGKLGLGTAYIAGFHWALERDYAYIFEMDADFSHNPKDLPRLLDACANGAGVAVGSRYVQGGQVENWPFDRIFLSRGASVYVQTMLWMPVADPTAGFICYTREALSAINLNAIKFIGYAFQIEMKYAAWQNGFKITEVPITFKDRELGSSKMSLKIIREAILGVFSMRLSRYKKKV